jgi:hypothetical protein
MKNILLICCASALAITACNDEPQAPKDKTAPEITLTSPTAADFYQDGLLIQASAIDDEAVASLEAYIDDTQIDAQTTGPISITIDTRPFEDGTHTLKIVSKDAAGNEAKLEKTINLLNYVVRLKLVANKPQANTQYFFYLLDEAGSLVEDNLFKASTSSTEIKFNTPANHAPGRIYTVGFFEHEEAANGWPAQNRFYIVPGYTPGVYNEAIGFNEIVKPDGGSHTVNFTGLPDPLLAAFHTENWGNFPVLTNSLFLSLDKNGANAYVAIMPDYNQAPMYKALTGLASGGTTTLSPNDFTPMSGVAVPGSESSLYTFSFVYGMKKTGDYTDGRIIWAYNIAGIQPDKKEFQIYYPANYYPEYYTGFEEVLSDHYDQYFSFSATPPTTFKRLNGKVTGLVHIGEIFEIETEGSYDLLELHGGHNSSDGTEINYLWTIALPSTNKFVYKLPHVPQQLIDMFGIPPSTEWNTPVEAILNDFSGVTGYDDYFKKNYANAPDKDLNYISWRKHSNEWLLRSQRFFNNGGRIHTSQDFIQNHSSNSARRAHR